MNKKLYFIERKKNIENTNKKIAEGNMRSSNVKNN
jgi:hypothetical protein